MVGESMHGRRSDGPEGVLTEQRPGHPDGLVDEQRRRRRAAEAVADAAEAAAEAAAARASAAIAAAAAAAADAEAAADLAARAAADAESALAAERRAVERSHALSTVGANETTTVVAAPVPDGAPLGGVEPYPLPAVPGQALPPDEAVVARAATMTMPAVPGAARPGRGTPSAPGIPAPDDRATGAHATGAHVTGGRAARRRAQEAAAAAAAVNRQANRDPDTHVFTVEPGPGETTPAPLRRTRSEERAGSSVDSLFTRLRGRPGARMLLVAGGVGGVVLVAALVAGMLAGSRGSSNAAVVEEVPVTAVAAAPTSAAADPDDVVDPTSAKAVAFLGALRAADVPTSDSGQSETEAAEVICQQLAAGAEEADLVRVLPAVLPAVNARQAKTVVSIAQSDYCS
jgi:hypothetical protein